MCLKPNLLIVSADLDGIWDELGSFFLCHRGHVFQQDSDLKKTRRVIYYVYAAVRISVYTVLISTMA